MSRIFKSGFVGDSIQMSGLELLDERVVRRVGEVGVFDADVEAAQHALEEAVSRAVDLLLAEDGIARFERKHDGADAADAAGKDGGVLRILQRGEGGLEVAEVRVAAAGVIKAARISRLEGRGHVDRRDHGAGFTAPVLPDVDGTGLKTGVGGEGGVFLHVVA